MCNTEIKYGYYTRELLEHSEWTLRILVTLLFFMLATGEDRSVPVSLIYEGTRFLVWFLFHNYLGNK